MKMMVIAVAIRSSPGDWEGVVSKAQRLEMYDTRSMMILVFPHYPER